MIIGIIILSVLLVFWIALFFIYYYQVKEVSKILLLKIPGVELTFDIQWTNEFNIAKIIKDLGVPIKSPLYTLMSEEEAYLENIEENFITARIINRKTGIRITRKYDKYGIDVNDTVTKRRPRNCQVFLVPYVSKFSWYTIIEYVTVIKDKETFREEEPTIPLSKLQDLCCEYCKNYCILECSKECSLKEAGLDSNKMKIIEKIDKYCEQSCSFSNCCLGSSCILYKIKNR